MPDEQTPDQSPGGNSVRSSPHRPNSSYRRPIPRGADLTHTEEHPLASCPDCGSLLSQLKTILRYVEDVLPLAEWHKVLKRVTKQLITTGYCSGCRERKTAMPISAHAVTLGKNIRPLISFQTAILRLSYQQIRDFFMGILHFSLSDGEISNLLAREATVLLPLYAQIKTAIGLQRGSHYDETSWPVQGNTRGNYAWVMTGTETPEAVFLLGRTRGKENAEELKGTTHPDRTGITDDYPAYQNLFSSHQLCWAHPHRKIRDLAESTALTREKHRYCQKAFHSFAALYRQVREVVAQPFVLAERLAQKRILLQRFMRCTQPHSLDPLKLRKVKQRLRERKAQYFTCLTHQGVPTDNNKAERSLRHLVLKRKSSFGSRSQKGADVMGVLYSVLLSWWWKSKEIFFQNYACALDSS